MPRRLGRFQQACVDWHAANHSRFLVPVSLTMVKPGSVLVKFLNQPDCFEINACSTNLGVWVRWQGNICDAWLDLDVLPAQTRHGLICQLCVESLKIWPSLETLWSDHLFEPLLAWANNDLAKAQSLLLFGNLNYPGTAILCCGDRPKDKELAAVEIPLNLNLSA